MKSETINYIISSSELLNEIKQVLVDIDVAQNESRLVIDIEEISTDETRTLRSQDGK